MNELVKLSQARKYLAEAKNLVEIKQIKDVAKATFAFAKAKGLSKEIQDDAGVLVIEAGIEFSKMKKVGQEAGEIKTSVNNKSLSSKKELSDFGVKKKESYHNDQFAKDEEVTFQIIEDLKKQDERITEGAVLNQIKEKEKEYKKQQRIKEADELSDNTNVGVDLRLGDFRKIFTDIEDSSIDLILTDPPYPREYIALWDDLSQFANRVLKPSGFLIAYSGHLYLPQVYRNLSNHLIYYWTACLYHTGQTQLQQYTNIIVRWKPILFYQKAPRKKVEVTFQDYFISEKPEKDLHEWQQNEGAVNKIIELFTKPQDIILDPFAGSGSFLSASKKLKRVSIGAEIDEQSYKLARKRLYENL